MSTTGKEATIQPMAMTVQDYKNKRKLTWPDIAAKFDASTAQQAMKWRKDLICVGPDGKELLVKVLRDENGAVK